MNGVRVTVPASSANLGPGFDCLALALDLHLGLVARPIGDDLVIEIAGEGAGQLPHDETNLIFQALRAVYHEHGRQASGLHLTVANQIPVKSGLGSSSAALVAGALAAFGLLSVDPEPGFVLQLARRLEGHADNAAASLLGGLVAVGPAEGQIDWLTLPLEPVKLVVVLPEVELSTRAMRGVLPATVEHAAATRNVARVPFLLEALRRGDLSLLGRAAPDELHEPHRLSRIPGAAKARQAGLAAGAAAVVLSGAGPALMAFVDDELIDEVARAMQSTFEAVGVSARVLHLRPEFRGATLSMLD